MTSDLFSLTQRLEFSSPAQEQWQQLAFLSTRDRWNAYLNQLCLNAFLPWLQADRFPQAKAWTTPNALPSFWSLVNGTALTLHPPAPLRLILLPTETIDHDELRVPQEWVDIPSWAGDYYLAVQVEPEERWVQVWGYTTHHKLKTRGQYNASDRTYSISESDLIQDLSVLWVGHQLEVEATRTEVAPLPTLSLTQANNLIERLSNPAVITPRLEIPFQQWGALIEHGGWRQRLYERRQGLTESRSILQWLQTGISNLAQQIGWERIELQPDTIGARSDEQPETIAVLTRQLTIAGQTYELQVIPQESSQLPIWRFQLRNGATGGMIPGGFRLRLLTEDLQPFEGNEDVATSAVAELAIVVALEPGEGIVWEIEPIPEDYDREILRF